MAKYCDLLTAFLLKLQFRHSIPLFQSSDCRLPIILAQCYNDYAAMIVIDTARPSGCHDLHCVEYNAVQTLPMHRQ